MVVIGRNAPYNPRWHFTRWIPGYMLFWDCAETGDFHHLTVIPWGAPL